MATRMLHGMLYLTVLMMIALSKTEATEDLVDQVAQKLEEVLASLKKATSPNLATPGHQGNTSEHSGDNEYKALESVRQRMENLRRYQDIITEAFEDEKLHRQQHEQRVKRDIEALAVNMLSLNETSERLGLVMSKTNAFLKDLEDFRDNITRDLQHVVSANCKEIHNSGCCELVKQTTERVKHLENLITKQNENLAYMYHKHFNVAQYKEAFQSSSFYRWSVAARAVDGNTNINLEAVKSCTCTNQEARPWWMVDLGENFYVGRVVIYNRGSHTGDRLKDFEVLVSENKETGYEIFALRPGKSYDGEVITLRKSPRSYGRYLKIQLKGYNFLQLCEVMAFYD